MLTNVVGALVPGVRGTQIWYCKTKKVFVCLFVVFFLNFCIFDTSTNFSIVDLLTL